MATQPNADMRAKAAKKKCGEKSKRTRRRKDLKKKFSARNEIKMFIDEALRFCVMSLRRHFRQNRLSVFILLFRFFFFLGPSNDNNNNNLFERRLILAFSDHCPLPTRFCVSAVNVRWLIEFGFLPLANEFSTNVAS